MKVLVKLKVLDSIEGLIEHDTDFFKIASSDVEWASLKVLVNLKVLDSIEGFIEHHTDFLN